MTPYQIIEQVTIYGFEFDGQKWQLIVEDLPEDDLYEDATESVIIARSIFALWQEPTVRLIYRERLGHWAWELKMHNNTRWEMCFLDPAKLLLGLEQFLNANHPPKQSQVQLLFQSKIHYLENLLERVYGQCGNHCPAECRHCLTPVLRDEIQNYLLVKNREKQMTLHEIKEARLRIVDSTTVSGVSHGTTLYTCHEVLRLLDAAIK